MVASNRFFRPNSGSVAATGIAHTAPGTIVFSESSAAGVFTGENGVLERTLEMSWTGDQTLSVTIQVQAGVIGGAAEAAATDLTVALAAGNVTPQQFVLTAAGIRQISGTTTLTGNAGDMNAPFTTFTVIATAGAAPTLGTLAWDYSETGTV